MIIQTRELTPALWPELERLFGKNGACAGCWCMYWRVEEGERYDDLRGATAKRRQKRLVAAGKSLGEPPRRQVRQGQREIPAGPAPPNSRSGLGVLASWRLTLWERDM
jgi:hypothetical protein